MALTIKLDAAQMQEIRQLTAAVNDLSVNLAKWLGAQDETIARGFADTVAVLGGADNGDDQQIQQIADNVKSVRERLKTSVDSQTDSQTKGD